MSSDSTVLLGCILSGVIIAVGFIFCVIGSIAIIYNESRVPDPFKSYPDLNPHEEHGSDPRGEYYGSDDMDRLSLIKIPDV